MAKKEMHDAEMVRFGVSIYSWVHEGVARIAKERSRKGVPTSVSSLYAEAVIEKFNLTPPKPKSTSAEKAAA